LFYCAQKRFTASRRLVSSASRVAGLGLYRRRFALFWLSTHMQLDISQHRRGYMQMLRTISNEYTVGSEAEMWDIVYSRWRCWVRQGVLRFDSERALTMWLLEFS
jgi:hypothetical protein